MPDAQRLAALLELASQAEAAGDSARAEALHQRRLAAKNEAQARQGCCVCGVLCC